MFSSLHGLAHQGGEPINGRADQDLDVGEQFVSGTSYYFWIWNLFGEGSRSGASYGTLLSQLLASSWGTPQLHSLAGGESRASGVPIHLLTRFVLKV